MHRLLKKFCLYFQKSYKLLVELLLDPVLGVGLIGIALLAMHQTHDVIEAIEKVIHFQHVDLYDLLIGIP